MATQYAVEEKPGAAGREQSLLIPVATTELPKLPSKPTAQCFVGPQYGSRNDHLDRWLLPYQPGTSECVVTTFRPEREATEVEWAAALLGVSVEMPAKSLMKFLKEREYTMSLIQMEEMVERTRQGLRTGVPTDGWSGFCFVENKTSGVELAGIYCDEGEKRWHLKFSPNRDIHWRRRHRLLVPNWNAPKL